MVMRKGALPEKLYMISMAIAFSMEVNNVALPFFLKYGIAIFWIIIAIIQNKGRISDRDVRIMKLFSIPMIVAFVYTIVIWIVNTPEGVNFSYFSRLVSNLGCMVVIAVCAVMMCSLFGKRVVYLSFYALIITIGYNFVIVLREYGTASMVEYLKNVFSLSQFEYGSIISNISYGLEVHDATFAMGIFLVYFIFYEDKNENRRLLHIILALVCSYLGFKRNEMLAIIVVTIVALIFVRKKSKDFLKTSQFLGFGMFIIGMAYTILIKNIDILPVFVKILDIARINLYHFLSEQYTISPFYLGKGFSYINHRLGFESKLLDTSHTDLVRVYIEMGIYGFGLWIWYYFVNIPRKLYREYSETAAKFFLIGTFYVFSTYFLDNTLTLFDNQFIYYLIPLALCYKDQNLETIEI